MTSLPFPIFALDFEASGGGPESYPIEAGLSVWRGVDQPIVTWSALIAPVDYWTHWDWNAQSIHGIERAELAAGSPPAVVAARLNELADRLDTAEAGRLRAWLALAKKGHRAADDADRALKGFARAVKAFHVATERRSL